MALSDIETRLIELGLIPWDKSFTIRMGYMDFFRGKTSIFKFLEREKDNLSGDLLSFWQLMIAWKEGKPMKTESATTLRFFIYPSWMAQDHRVFIKQGSLINRQITDDPRKVIYQPTNKLILLDGGTSQWASAAYLYYWSIKKPWMKINNPPPKLQSTYEDVEYYDRLNWREMGECWKPQRDRTILKQVVAVIDMLKTVTTLWRPEHSEDCCIAMAFGMSVEEVKKLFPSAIDHETNRFTEMPKVIADVKAGREITSIDHRAIWAGVALQLIQGREVKVRHPEAVGKSWPPVQFWKCVDFLKGADF
ncbi:MAG: hypothetical protein Q7R46_00890 [bacterium]|nr:hypothetical protein [bacterium]